MIKKLLTAALATCLLGATPQLQSAGYALPALAAGTGLLTGLDAGAFSYKKNAYPTYSRYAPLAALYGTAAAACFSKGITQFLPDNSFGTALKIAGGAALTVSTAYLGFKLTRQKHNLEVAQKITELTAQENKIYSDLLKNQAALDAFIRTPENERFNNPLVQTFRERLTETNTVYHNFIESLQKASDPSDINRVINIDSNNNVTQLGFDKLIKSFKEKAASEFTLGANTVNLQNTDQLLLTYQNFLNKFLINECIHRTMLLSIGNLTTQQVLELANTEAAITSTDFQNFITAYNFITSTIRKENQYLHAIISFLSPLQPLEPKPAVSSLPSPREQWYRSLQAQQPDLSAIAANATCPLCADNLLRPDTASELIQMPPCDCKTSTQEPVLRNLHKSCYLSLLKSSDKPFGCLHCRKNSVLFPPLSFVQKVKQVANKIAALVPVASAIPSLCAAGYNYDMPIFRNAFLCAGVGSMIPALTGELYRKLDPSRTFIRKTLKTTGISAGAGFLMYAFGELCLHTIGDSTPAKRRACLALPILLGAYTSKHIFNFASDPALELSNVPVVQPEEENPAQLQQNAQQLALGQPEPVQPNIGAADANEPEFDEDDAVF